MDKQVLYINIAGVIADVEKTHVISIYIYIMI